VRKSLVDEKGSIHFRGTETVAVTRDSRWIGRRSFYVEHGDWFVHVCAGLATATAIMLARPRGAARPEKPAG